MSAPARRPLVGGNWKMHLARDEVAAWIGRFLAGPTAAREPAAEVVLFPSHPWLAAVADALAGTPFACGAQDLHPEEKGAHTGDVSGPQIASTGAAWALCGHSERRHDHGEGDELVARKVAAATAAGLQPLVCVGETGEERQAGRTFEVLERQLAAALAPRPAVYTLAYEPVWAIGTGETATPEIAEEAHRFLRETLADLVGEEEAGGRRILYGGSVKPGNAAELAAREEIDGFLVGGASLDPDDFGAIIERCA